MPSETMYQVSEANRALHTTELLLTDKEVGIVLGGVSRTTVWNHVKKGIIPKPIKLGGLARWPLSEINALIERAKDQR